MTAWNADNEASVADSGSVTVLEFVVLYLLRHRRHQPRRRNERHFLPGHPHRLALGAAHQRLASGAARAAAASVRGHVRGGPNGPGGWPTASVNRQVRAPGRMQDRHHAGKSMRRNSVECDIELLVMRTRRTSSRRAGGRTTGPTTPRGGWSSAAVTEAFRHEAATGSAVAPGAELQRRVSASSAHVPRAGAATSVIVVPWLTGKFGKVSPKANFATTGGRCHLVRGRERPATTSRTPASRNGSTAARRPRCAAHL